MSDTTLNLILASVIVPLLAALVPLLIAFINAKANEVKQRINDKKLERYLELAEDAVASAVLATYQTFVSTVKGTEGWNKETQKLAFEEAKAKALVILGTTAKQALEAASIDLQAWIDTKIEAYICANKEG
jgi:hypothetical protein